MHEDLRSVTEDHLRLLDRDLPGLVTDLLITGSLALGDYRPGISDIDFIALTTQDPAPDQLVALAALHKELPSKPPYDGIYLSHASLASAPVADQTAPQILAGDFNPAKPGGQLCPVTWLELRCAIVVRGRLPEIDLDAEVLREWLVGNLTGYWAQWATQVRGHLAALPDDEGFPSDLILWGVLGPGRLRYTLETGDVISKTGAGEFTARRYPRWRELCERAVAARAGEPTAFTVADGHAMIDLMTTVIAG